MAGVTPAIGDVAVMPLPGGGYGACQVTGVGKDEVTVCALAWYSEDQPDPRQLAGAGPLVLDHHAHPGRTEKSSIGRGGPPPPGWVWVGRQPVPAGLAASGATYPRWSLLHHQIALQWRWNRQLPAVAKRAYRAWAGRGQVDVDFGAGPVAISAATERLDLTRADLVPPPSSGAMRWSALDQLPRCTSLVWEGPDRGLVAALADRPIIQDLIWRQAPSSVDLRDTRLTSLSIGGAIERLHLPDGLMSLHLIGGAHAVTAAGDGQWLNLEITSPTTHAHIPAGLARVRDVELVGPGRISAVPLSILDDLETLELAWRDAPGALSDAAVLADLPRLAHLTLTEAYGICADTLPDLPALTGLAINGIRRTAATAIKARYRRTNIHLAITRAKNDTWLAANLTNPLRDWADDDPRAGAAACKAYATAVRAVAALPTDPPDCTPAAEPILRTFVQQLNRIDERYDFIDTLRRDEANDAFTDLAARAGVPTDLVDQWFDDWRTF